MKNLKLQISESVDIDIMSKCRNKICVKVMEKFLSVSLLSSDMMWESKNILNKQIRLLNQ